MAGRPGYSETEANLVRTICQPHGCVYSRPRTDKNGEPRCGVKYKEEAVVDFTGDGCMTAAQATKGDHVIPGVMTREGFTPFPGAGGMTRKDHQSRLDSEFYPPENWGKVVYKSS